MRWISLAVVVAACSSKPDAPAPPPPPPPPIAKAPCTRIVKLHPVATPPGSQGSLDGTGFGFVDENTLAVLYPEFDRPRLDGKPRGDDDWVGIALYDLRATYRNDHNDDTYLPRGSYSVRGMQMHLRPHTHTAMLSGPGGVATLELDTGCLRASTGITPRHAPQEPSPIYTLTAFDVVRGRFFVVTDTELVRVDGDTLQVTRRPAPAEPIDTLVYDDAGDLVIAKTQRDHALLSFDGATLADKPPLAIHPRYKSAGSRGEDPSIGDGPWPRPGHHEVMVTYFVAPPPCPEEAEHRLDRDEGLRRPNNRCPPPPHTGHRTALFDLATGAELAGVDAGLDMRPQATWSDSGDTFVADHYVVWRAGDPEPRAVDRIGGYSLTLDPSGTTFVVSNASYIQLGDLATGKIRWSVIAPMEHGGEH